MRTHFLWIILVILMAAVFACGKKSRLGTFQNAFTDTRVAEEQMIEPEPEPARISAPVELGLTTLEYLAQLSTAGGIMEGDLTLFALDAEYYPVHDVLDHLSLSISEEVDGIKAEILAEGLPFITDLYLYLLYLEDRINPCEVVAGYFFGVPEEDYLFFSQLNTPGLVPIGFAHLSRSQSGAWRFFIRKAAVHTRHKDKWRRVRRAVSESRRGWKNGPDDGRRQHSSSQRPPNAISGRCNLYNVLLLHRYLALAARWSLGIARERLSGVQAAQHSANRKQRSQNSLGHKSVTAQSVFPESGSISD